MSTPRVTSPRTRTPPSPECDPYIGQTGTPEFVRAEALAHKHGLTYLSISGIVKLSLLIRDIEAQRMATDTCTAVVSNTFHTPTRFP